MVRNRLRPLRLRSVRLTVWRARFDADLVFAMVWDYRARTVVVSPPFVKRVG